MMAHLGKGMVVKRGGLGRNLSALLSHTEGSFAVRDRVSENSHSVLSIHQLQPGKYQPRGEVDDVALAELTESIKKQGLLQPLVVREIDSGRYEIIAGERRWRACQLAGMTEIPVVLRQVDDETAMAMALVENLQREDLNAMDQARAMHRLTTEFGLTHQQVAELLCKSRTAVSNFLRLLNLSSDVRRMVEQGELEMGHARCLLMLEESQQHEVAKLVVIKGLSVRETEGLVARLKAPPKLPVSGVKKERVLPLFEQELRQLSDRLKTQVTIKPGKSGKGMLMIYYEDVQVLQQLINELTEA